MCVCVYVCVYVYVGGGGMRGRVSNLTFDLTNKSMKVPELADKKRLPRLIEFSLCRSAVRG